MMIETPTKFQVSGNPSLIDKALYQAYVKAIKQHIELLEEKKRGIEEIIINHEMTTPFVNGIIKGINLAIEQLYNDINQLKDK